MKRVNIHLTEKQIERLKKQAKDTGLSYAEIIRRIIDAPTAAEANDKAVRTRKQAPASSMIVEAPTSSYAGITRDFAILSCGLLMANPQLNIDCGRNNGIFR